VTETSRATLRPRLTSVCRLNTRRGRLQDTLEEPNAEAHSMAVGTLSVVALRTRVFSSTIVSIFSFCSLFLVLCYCNAVASLSSKVQAASGRAIQFFLFILKRPSVHCDPPTDRIRLKEKSITLLVSTGSNDLSILPIPAPCKLALDSSS